MKIDQSSVKSDFDSSGAFRDATNRFGDVVHVGGTMAFTTAYWVLGALKPDMMAFLGCDLVYPESGHHFWDRDTGSATQRCDAPAA